MLGDGFGVLGILNSERASWNPLKRSVDDGEQNMWHFANYS